MYSTKPSLSRTTTQLLDKPAATIWRPFNPRTPLVRLLVPNRGTIKVLDVSLPGAGVRGPHAISEHAVVNRVTENLDAFLDHKVNKPRRDARRIEADIHQIAYVVSRRTGMLSNKSEPLTIRTARSSK